MITFGVVCALLLVVALAFILLPLLQPEERTDTGELKRANVAVYRDQLAELEADRQNGIVSPEQYEQDREELERRLLEDVSAAGTTGKSPTPAANARSTAFALALALPILAVSLYLKLGDPKALSGPETASARPPAVAQSGGMTQQRIEANVASLAKRLEQNPGDSQGWVMLARSYGALGKFSEASGAFEKATALVGNNADLWADYAEAVVMANGQRLEGKPVELVNKALQIDPRNQKALALAGSAAFEAKNFKQATDYWERLLRQLPPGSEEARTLSEQLSKAKTLAGGGEK